MAGGAGIAGNLYVGGNILTTNLSIAQLNVGSSAGLTSTEAYDLDDISNYTDGYTNTFVPTYNGTQVSISNAWNLDVSVNGFRQPAFRYNSDVVWGGYALTASRGYCLDYAGNVRFADSVPQNSQVLMTVKPGTNTQKIKTYPFSPLDIMLGS